MASAQQEAPSTSSAVVAADKDIHRASNLGIPK